MQLRNLAQSTIDAYTYHVDKFYRHFGRPADHLGPEEIRQYQLFLVHDKTVSWSCFNQAVRGLRFLYEVTGSLVAPPTQRRRGKPFLVDNEALGRTFRRHDVDGLRRLLRNGKLRLEGQWSKLQDPAKLEAWLDEVTATDWNVFIEGPPTARARRTRS